LISLAYIDINPLRGGLVERPEKYRWNSLGSHVQTGNKDNFLSKDPQGCCRFRWGLFVKEVGGIEI